MKVLILNCSPHGDMGATALILNSFLEGMKEEGADVEVFYTRKLKINSCLGCFDCWVKTPGKCILDDDMQMLLPRLREADVWVFATPLYWDGPTGPMKNLIDRMVPFGVPHFEIGDGRVSHSLRDDVKRGKLVLVSSCGYWGIDNFDLLVEYMKRGFCRSAEREFAGALLRPHSMPFMGMLKMGKPVGDILEASKEAGKQLAREGKISPETLKTISRQLMPLEAFVQMANQKWQQAIESGKSPFA